MTLRRMTVSDFRCLQSVAFDLDPNYTLIVGANAAGKTSLLEAAYVMGRGRSFRTRRLENLIRSSSVLFRVHGEAVLGERRIGIGVEGSDGGIKARVGGEAVRSLAELAAVLPIQIIDPEVHHLIEEGPHRRRRFLDWGVFHVEPDFLRGWQRYQHVLRQRNAALRNAEEPSVVGAWNADLIKFGETISAARCRHVASLNDAAIPVARRLLGMDIDLTYRRGWAKGSSLADALTLSQSTECQLGSTQVGPQRADLRIRLNSQPVKDRISRGQQKLLAATLLLAQLNLVVSQSATRPTLLLDDPAAELDEAHLSALMNEVSQQGAQLVVTALHDDLAMLGVPGHRYRIVAGVVEPI